MKNYKYSQYVVSNDMKLIDALIILNDLTYKTLIVNNKKGEFFGTLTDGDIRRGLINNAKLNDEIKNIVCTSSFTLDKKEFKKEKYPKYFGKIDIIPILSKNIVVDVYVNMSPEKNDYSKNLNELCNVLIMAGGLGTRMRPITNFIPKPLVPLKDKSLIEHVMHNFSKYGITDFSFSVNYLADEIINYFKSKKHNYKINYIREKVPLGTIGALKNMDLKFESTFITNCDSLIDIDFFDMYNFHKSNCFDFTIAACEDIIDVPYGVCKVDQNLHLKSIHEKPKIINYLNTGLYLSESSVLKFIPINKRFDATQLISLCLENKLRVGVYRFRKEQWKDIGIFSDYIASL